MTEIDYYQHFECPMCKMWIPCYNIAGDCPHCGAEGFNDLKIKDGDNLK